VGKKRKKEDVTNHVCEEIKGEIAGKEGDRERRMQKQVRVQVLKGKKRKGVGGRHIGNQEEDLRPSQNKGATQKVPYAQI